MSGCLYITVRSRRCVWHKMCGASQSQSFLGISKKSFLTIAEYNAVLDYKFNDGSGRHCYNHIDGNIMADGRSIEFTKALFGDAYIDTVAEEIQNVFHGIKGFNRRGLYRMKKLYEIYADDEFVTALLSQISWQLWKMAFTVYNIC